MLKCYDYYYILNNIYIYIYIYILFIYNIYIIYIHKLHNKNIISDDFNDIQ